MQRSPRHSTAAFTSLGIMFVVVIIALLAGSAIYTMRGTVTPCGFGGTESDIRIISTQLEVYKVQNGSMPSTAQGLAALVTRPSGEPQRLCKKSAL